MKACSCEHLRSGIKDALSGRKSTPYASWCLEIVFAEYTRLLFLPLWFPCLRAADLFAYLLFCFSWVTFTIGLLNFISL